MKKLPQQILNKALSNAFEIGTYLVIEKMTRNYKNYTEMINNLKGKEKCQLA